MVATTNFGFYQPLVNNSVDQDAWGGELNTDLSEIDTVLYTAMNLTATAATTTITVTAATAGSTTTGSSNFLYLCNATGGAFAANLPAASTATNMVVAFKKTDSSANAITITGHSTDTIDGSNTFLLSTQYAWVIIVCDGTHWDIISQTPPAVNFPTASTTTSGILKLATAAMALTRTDATAALTASSIATNSSITTNGYYEFPGGFIVQWGQTGGIGGGSNGSVSFPLSFPAHCFSVVITKTVANSVNDPINLSNSSVTTSGFSYYNGGTAAGNAYWVAVGN